ncbi:MAG: hypothetical protein ABF649_22900, partial [Bacillus sp. (in: firmicutes)]
EETRSESLFTGLVCFVGAVIIYFLILLITGKLKKNNSTPLPETDERVQQNSLKFFAQMLGLSHIIAAVIVIILMVTNQSVIQTEYILYYVVAVLFLTMIIGGSIIRKL